MYSPKINQRRIITLSGSTDVVDTKVLQQRLHLWAAEECMKTCYTCNTYMHDDYQQN